MWHWSLHNRPMVLFISLSTSFWCSSNDKRIASIILLSLSLKNYICSTSVKVKGGWESLLTFLLKITSWPCLLGPGLKLIFHFCTLELILAKSLLSSAAALSILCITKNNEVPSANNLALHDNSSASSFIYIKKVLVLVWSLVGFLR